MSVVVDVVRALAGVNLGMTWGEGRAWGGVRWLRAGGLGRGYGAVQAERFKLGTAGWGLVWVR
ncbi:MAG: hypothetical protein C4321_11235 [Chloroflexota bacterium]